MSFYVPDGWNARQWSSKQWGDNHVLQNNPWGAISGSHLDRPIPRDQWYQAIGLNDEGNPSCVFSYPAEYFDPSKVIAYPELVVGNKFGTLDSGADGYPIQVRDIDQVNIDFDYRMFPHPMRESEKAINNVALETFFHNRLPIVGPGHPDHDPRNTQVMFELMVWLETPDSNEIGLGDPLGKVIDRLGNEFDLYSYKSDYCAFHLTKRNSPIVCWSDFIQAVNGRSELDNINPDWYISAFEGGPEIWTGSGLFEWLKFDVDVKLKGQGTGDTKSSLYSRLATCHRDLAQLYDDIAAL